MPLALARKYRPKSFADVAVQSHVATTLKGAIAHDRVAHGYLFCGPRGTGKTTLARVLAMALNCEHRGERDDGEPCGTCASCQRIWSGSASLDVVEIDAASNRGVDDARELRERAMYAPSTAERYKVYIVDEAHMLTREAWNALLKILEEPPPRVVFVFATTEPQKIAQAAAPVLSRLQRFDLKRIGAADIRHRLRVVLAAEGVSADDESLAILSRAADGSMRDALSLADQVLALGDVTTLGADQVRNALGLVSEDECLAVLELVAEGRAGAVFPAVARLADAGVDFTSFLAAFADLLRAQLALLLGAETAELSERARGALAAHRQRWSAGDVLRMLSAVTELEPRFRRSGQQQMLLETLLVRCALIDRSVVLEDVLRTLGTGAPPATPRSVAASAAAPAARPVNAIAAPASPRVPARQTAVPVDLPIRTGGGQVAQPAQVALIDGTALQSRWPEIVAAVRRDRQAPMLAAALEESTPAPGPTPHVIVIRLSGHNEIVARALQSGRDDIVAALRTVWPQVEQISIVQPDDAPGGPPRRLSVEALRADQVAALRRGDAVLGAAIDALDLELIE
jgi:DNA polymerase III subunit gamma/tau